MAGATSEPYVESYHINVLDGDAAFHLLLDLSTLPPTVLSTVLIDGGHRRMAGEILNLNKDLAEELQNDYPNKVLLCDTIVITHWDEDHCGGIFKLINNSFKADKNIDAENCILKFDHDNKDKPQTYLYVPSTDELPNAHFTIIKKGRTTLFGELRDGEIFVHLQYGKYRLVENVCKLRSEKFLGVNFFTNKLLPTDESPDTMTSPETLVDANKPNLPGGLSPVSGANVPGLYCVGFDSKILGAAIRPTIPRRKEIKMRQLGGTIDIVDLPGATATNKSSIAAMIIWDGTYRLSHYTAGDLDFEKEDAIVTWTGTDGDITKVGKWVSSMKVSHHGAREHTPSTILEKFRSKNIVISCGRKHLHPAYELILFIHALQLNADKSPWLFPLKPMLYPYWFERDGRSGALMYTKKIKDVAFTDSRAACVAYRTKLNALFQEAGVENPSFLEQFHSYRDDTDMVNAQFDGDKDKAGKYWLTRFTNEAWMYGQLTEIQEEYCAKGNSWWGPAKNFVPAMKQVRCIRIRSFDDDEDGEAQYENRHSGVSLRVATPPRRGRAAASSDSSGTTMLAFKPDPSKLDGAEYGTNAGTAAALTSSSSGDNTAFNPKRRGKRMQAFRRTIRPSDGSASASTSGSDNGDASSPYYVYCSEVAIPSSETNSSIHTTSGTAMDTFLRSLHTGFIELNRAPKTNDNGSWISIADDDELYKWLGKAFMGFTLDSEGFSACWSTSDPFISKFKLELGGPASFTFDTDSASEVFSSYDGSTITCTNVVILGLTADSDKYNPTLGDVVGLAGLGGDYSDALGGLKDIKLVLDPTQTDRTETRNAVWFSPMTKYRTSMRLQFDIDGTDTYLKHFFSSFIADDKFSVTPTRVILRTTASYLSPARNAPADDSAVYLLFDFTAMDSSTSSAFSGVLDLHAGSLRVVLSADDESTNLATLISWLEALLTSYDVDFSDLTKKVWDADLILRRVELDVSWDPDSSKHSIEQLRIDTELHLEAVDNAVPVLLFSYVWPSGKCGRLEGRFWPQLTTFDAIAPELHPTFEEFDIVEPSITNPAPYVDLTKLIPGVTIDNVPDFIPTLLDAAELSIDSNTISFRANVQTKENISSPVAFDEVTLCLSYDWQNLDVSFYIDVELSPPPGSSTALPATFNGEISYSSDDSTWSFDGSIDDVSASYLSLLIADSEVKSSISSILNQCWLSDLQICFDYSASPTKAKNVTGDGILLLGGLELDLKAQIDDQGGFAFHGTLRDRSDTSSIQSIATGLFGAAADLPSFVEDIIVDLSKDGATFEVDISQARGYLVFSASLRIAPLKCTVFQLWKKGWAEPKRILKVATMKLPDISVPLMDGVNWHQPFDELAYLWVYDGSAAGGSPGFSTEEIDLLNLSVAGAQDDKVYYKSGSAVALAVGSHFQVIADLGTGPTCVLDMVFSKPSQTSGDASSSNLKRSQSLTAVGADDGGGNSDDDEEVSAIAPYHRKVGILSLRNIGLRYVSSTKTLFIIVDVKVSLGPISATLIGFGLGLPLQGVTLQTLPSNLQLTLDGIGLSFDRPPVDLAGLLEHHKDATSDTYQGGVVLGLEDYMFVGAGMYGNVTSGSTTFVSMFAFAELDGLLLTLEFAEISGVKGGLGYNSTVKLPDQTNVSEFPLVGSSLTVQTDSLGTLEELLDSGWITASNGDYWLASGMRIDALQVLFGDVVLVCGFGDDVKFALVADTVVQVPPAASNESRKYLFAKLGVAAEVDFSAGTALLAGQMDPSSFILDPSCHMTGEFALFYWFGGNEHAGDWVVSLGGYHPAFMQPSYYPKVNRVEIIWSVDDNLSITGKAYLAVVPKMCMAGGMLDAEFQSDHLDASFTAALDFLLRLEPFYFDADISVNISLTAHATIGGVTFDKSGSLDANLHVMGPPTHGSVYIDIWDLDFTIYFGADSGSSAPPNDTLEQFCNLVDPKGCTSHLYNCLSGRVPTSSNAQVVADGEEWKIGRTRLSFNIVSPFPFGKAIAANTVFKWDTSIYAQPMGLPEGQTITSTITITITCGSVDVTNKFAADQITKNLPAAMWGPSMSVADLSSVLDGSNNVVIPLMNGITLTGPGPVFPPTNILAFNIIDFMMEEVFTGDDAPSLPEVLWDDYVRSWAPLARNPNAEKQYEDVKNRWLSPLQPNGASDTFETYQSLLGWYPSVALKTEPPKLALQSFEQIYPTAPHLGYVEDA